MNVEGTLADVMVGVALGALFIEALRIRIAICMMITGIVVVFVIVLLKQPCSNLPTCITMVMSNVESGIAYVVDQTALAFGWAIGAGAAHTRRKLVGSPKTT